MRISDWSSDVCASELPGADHRAVVTCTGQLLFQHGAGALIGRDHAKVGLPAPFRDRGHRDLDPRVDLRRIEARRDGRVGKVHGLRLLADEKYARHVVVRSEEHTSELQSLMRISYAVLCLKNKKHT